MDGELPEHLGGSSLVGRRSISTYHLASNKGLALFLVSVLFRMALEC